MALQHSNVMPVLAVCKRRQDSEILVVMRHMEAGTIADLIANKQVDLDQPTVLAIAQDVAHLLVFFHNLEPAVVGQNIKPHHIFQDSGWRSVIGLSFRPPTHQSVWAPPECLCGETWQKAADSYAFAMLLVVCHVCSK